MAIARQQATAIGAAALVVLAVLGYWGYGAHQKRALEGRIVALLAEPAARLQRVLDGDAGDVEAHAAAAEASLKALRELDTRANRALGDAADEYLVTTREIFRRHADRLRLKRALDESSAELRRHMRSDNRTGAWVKQAVATRERVSRDHRGYQIAAEALEGLLLGLPATQRKVAPWLDAQRLVSPERLEAAAARVKADAAASAKAFRQLDLLRAAR